MIQLGLARIAQLLGQTPQPWRAIHVAGTNGKGSVCAAASAMLYGAGIAHGRFTSPHLIDRWDCIAINGQPVVEHVFREMERVVMARNERERIKATEFELLTATAFELFTQARIEVGVVEVGVGGRLDATNILHQPLVTVICNVGLDHQSLLGDTIEEIAAEKAGILKPGVPCVVAGSNKPSVIKVIERRAKQISAGALYTVNGLPDDAEARTQFDSFLQPRCFQPHEILNMACAHKAVVLALGALGRDHGHQASVFRSLTNIKLPGRIQTISLGRIACRKSPVVLDGAHNVDSAYALSQFIEPLRMNGKGSVVWVLSISHGKAMADMLALLLKDGDSVVAVEFGPVAGMPWVKATPSTEVIAAASTAAMLNETAQCGPDVLAGLRKASYLATNDGHEKALVIAGSLYLVSDVLRLLRDRRVRW